MMAVPVPVVSSSRSRRASSPLTNGWNSWSTKGRTILGTQGSRASWSFWRRLVDLGPGDRDGHVVEEVQLLAIGLARVTRGLERPARLALVVGDTRRGLDIDIWVGRTPERAPRDRRTVGMDVRQVDLGGRRAVLEHVRPVGQVTRGDGGHEGTGEGAVVLEQEGRRGAGPLFDADLDRIWHEGGDGLGHPAIVAAMLRTVASTTSVTLLMRSLTKAAPWSTTQFQIDTTIVPGRLSGTATFRAANRLSMESLTKRLASEQRLEARRYGRPRRPRAQS